jgi:hypothetical protein
LIITTDTGFIRHILSKPKATGPAFPDTETFLADRMIFYGKDPLNSVAMTNGTGFVRNNHKGGKVSIMYLEITREVANPLMMA